MPLSALERVNACLAGAAGSEAGLRLAYLGAAKSFLVSLEGDVARARLLFDAAEAEQARILKAAAGASS